MLLVYLLYNICKYLYNDPGKSKDKLGIAIYFVYVAAVLSKKHKITVYSEDYILCKLPTYKAWILKL